MKVKFRDYILGHIRSSGMTVDDFCDLCDITKPTLYRKLNEPDRIDRTMIRVLHKHCGLTYEDLMERR